jgi:uncharacterized tellurite resistance protein B-like protein
MFGRWLKSAATPAVLEGADGLIAVARAHLPDADAETVEVVVALAGLIGVVAYADRHYSAEEENRLRQELSRVRGMTDAGISAICELLRRHIVEVATVQLPRYARTLCELADVELRVEVLEVLVDVAASDGVITHDETNVLRHITKALGLDQQHYNAAQARHRDKLSALKPR